MRFLPALFIFSSCKYLSSFPKNVVIWSFGHLVILPFFMLCYWICRLFVEDRRKRKQEENCFVFLLLDRSFPLYLIGSVFSGLFPVFSFFLSFFFFLSFSVVFLSFLLSIYLSFFLPFFLYSADKSSTILRQRLNTREREM